MHSQTFIPGCQPHCKRIERTAVLGGVIMPHKRISLCIHRFDVHASAVRSRNSTDSLVRLQVHALLLYRVPRDPLSPLHSPRVRWHTSGPGGTPSSLEKRQRRTYFENVVTQRTRTEPRRRRRPVQGGGSAKGPL